MNKTDSKSKPQQPTTISLAHKVSRDVELEAVLLRRANLKSHVDPDFQGTDFEIEQEYKSTYELDEHPAKIKVSIAFRFFLADPNDDDAVFLTLDAEYLLVYSVPDVTVYDPDSLTYFAELNGTVNVWPYWRELVHTVTARVGLGSITLPVFRAKARPVETRDAADATREGSLTKGAGVALAAEDGATADENE